MEWTVSQTHKILLNLTPESYEIIRMTVELLREEEMGGVHPSKPIKCSYVTAFILISLEVSNPVGSPALIGFISGYVYILKQYYLET